VGRAREDGIPVSEDLEQLDRHRRAVGNLVPLLDAIAGIGEIAYRRASERLVPAHNYANAVRDQMARIERLPALPETPWPGNPHGRTALLVVTSERGLCGRFNHHLVEQAIAEQQRLSAGEGQVDVLVLGRRGAILLEESGVAPVFRAAMPSVSRPTYLDAERIAVDLLDLVEQHGYRRLDVLSARPAGRLAYKPAIQCLLPPEPSPAGEGSTGREPGLKPAGDLPHLIARLVTERLLAELYVVLIQSVISEQLARVFAMRLAVSNARRLVSRLDVEYNAARQQQITRELSEVVGAFQAVSAADDV